MNISKTTIAIFLSHVSSNVEAGTKFPDIKEVVGDGCKNNVNFRSYFMTDTDSKCNTCSFCDGSHLSSLFDPKVESTCIDCVTAENTCNSLTIITDFNTPWLMESITLTSSAMGYENDPFKIVLKASDKSNTWQTIYDSQVSFSQRKKSLDLVFNNNKHYINYSITFQRKKESTKMYLGQYGLVKSYTKRCAANLHGDITGDKVLPFKTLAPTESPTVEVIPFRDLSALKAAVNLWTSDRPAAITKHGHVKDWNTSLVKSMYQLFISKTSFNDDVSLWSTSSVTNMVEMFRNTRSFNVDISRWDTSSVKSMDSMFRDAASFNADLSQWNISQVTQFYAMFMYSTSFDQKLCWNVTGAETMFMFTDSSGSIGCD